MSICVDISNNESLFEHDNSSTFKAKIEHYLKIGDNMCYIVRRNATRDVLLVPADMIKPSTVFTMRLAPRTPLAGCQVMYKIRKDVERDVNGRRVADLWTRANVIRQIGDDHILVRLIDYDETDWWSGYDVLPIDSNRLKFR